MLLIARLELFSLFQSVLDIAFSDFLPPCCRENSGIVAALTSEASHFATLKRAVAVQKETSMSVMTDGNGI
jgi:hypothetical protein